MNRSVIVKTYLLAAVGGSLFFVLSVPLAWMLGPLATVVIFSQALKQPMCWPVSLRNAALVILGYVIGKSFTTDAARQVAAQLPVMLTVTAIILGMSLLFGYLTHRRAGISLSTGLMGCVPGGFSQMVLMSEEIANTDVSVVSFMHTARLMSVIFIVPSLATQAAGLAGIVPAGAQGAAAEAAAIFTPLPLRAVPLLLLSVGFALFARRTHWPTPFLLGPIFGAALAAMAGVDCPALPLWLTIPCQIAVGAYMGTQIQIESLSNWRILLLYTMLGVVAVLAASLGAAYLLAYFYGYSTVTAFLSMAPGGVAEMSVTGIALQADLSVIASYQLFRLFFIMLFTPMLFRKYLKPSKP